MVSGLSLGLGLGRPSLLSGVVSIPAPFTALGVDGWQSTVTNPADLSLSPFTVTRAGFDDAGVAASFSDTVYLTKRIRQAYPNEASLTADQVAISEVIYAADSFDQATNNSTAVSPKPVAAWVMMDRIVIGDLLAWEAVAFHKDARQGKQVACVAVRATDGTNTTAWQYVTQTTLSTYCDDANAPEVYAGSLDVSGLNDDAGITLQGKVFPHFGIAASVLDSDTETEYRFSPRYFWRSTTRLAAPPLAYVESTGDDGTGAASTNSATASASPFATLAGAMAGLRVLLGSATNDAFSGAEIRIVDAVTASSNPGFQFYYQDYGAVRITRAPGTTRAAANLTVAVNMNLFPSAPSGTDLTNSAVIFEDMTVTMSGARSFSGQGARRCHYQFKDCNFDFGSTNQFTGMRNVADLSFFGIVGSGYGGIALSYSTSGDIRMLRGFTADCNDASLWGYNVIGCALDEASILMAQAERGALIYNNEIEDVGASIAIQIDAATAGNDMGGVAVVQNLIPRLRANASAAIRISGDSGNGNVSHLVMHHNTTPGDGNYNRWNLLYDETSGTARTHLMVSFKGNLGPQLNTKSDIFLTDGTRVGNFSFVHGVGCNGNFTKDLDAAGGSDSFRQTYGGIGSVIAGGDPLYTDGRAVQDTPTAGSAGGDYSLTGSSPANAIATEQLLSFDISGSARASGAQDAGCYA